MWQYLVSTPSYPSTFPIPLFKIQPPSVRILQLNVQNKMVIDLICSILSCFKKNPKILSASMDFKSSLYIIFRLLFMQVIYIYIDLIFWKYCNQWWIFLLLCLFEMMQEAKQKLYSSLKRKYHSGCPSTEPPPPPRSFKCGVTELT